ncbi:DUF6261 family protein [Ancylomarina longa]|uniref:Uncharacterized protein n=1 Tax=Ancylomarina longa TaxID=2487017 RepID=A0A434AFW0_9BACT|nr:DUF6261 family protein [Ancylomarina longa]RUT73258.1 hypothetical protein DLK05_14360 [Ancylomarina longa]
MNQKIYHYCDTGEINTLASNIVYEFSKSDWSADPVISNIITTLAADNLVFSKSIKASKHGFRSKMLQKLDDIADKDFICLKQFVWANTHMPDETISANARKIWQIIDANNLNLHRLGYERQMALSHSLLTNLEEENVKPMVDSLIGVSDLVKACISSLNNFESLFRSEKEEIDNEDDIIAPSSQKKIVRNIINQKLIPYLNTVVSVLPEQYETIAQVIENHIVAINTKARSRQSRNTSNKPEISLSE